MQNFTILASLCSWAGRIESYKDKGYFSAKTYVVGTQKNHLNETVLLSNQNTCLNRWLWKWMQLYTQNVLMFVVFIYFRILFVGSDSSSQSAGTSHLHFRSSPM